MKNIIKKIFALGCLSLAVFCVAGDATKKKPTVIRQDVYAEEVLDEKEVNSQQNSDAYKTNEQEDDENNTTEEVIEYQEDDENNTTEEVIEYQADEEISICVFGKAKTSVSPDSATIYARIETLESDINLSKENNFTLFENVIASLKEKGIEENNVNLEFFNCQPSYDYSTGKKLMGYYSTTSFSFDISDLDNVKGYIDGLVENGVTSIDNINFKVSNLDEQYNQTLTQAIENARSKAESMLGESELNLVKLKEEYVYSCNNIVRTYEYSLIPSSFVGKVDIEAQVLAVFEK